MIDIEASNFLVPLCYPHDASELALIVGTREISCRAIRHANLMKH